MRRMMTTALVLLAACSDPSTVSVNGADGAGGYTIEVRASEAEQTYLVTTPDGRTVGARAADGASALMDASRAQALASEPPLQSDEDVAEVMALRLPGFEMSIGGAEENAESEHGRVALRIGGEATNIVVDANEGGPGVADDRARVLISGASEEAVRDFIVEADRLSPAVQAEMLAELGIE